MSGGQKKAELVVDAAKGIVAVQLGEALLALDEPARERLAAAIDSAVRGLLGLAPLGSVRMAIALDEPAQAASGSAASAQRKSSPAGPSPAEARAKVLQIARKLTANYRPLLAQRIQQKFGVTVPEDRDPDLKALTGEQWMELLQYMEQAAGRRAS